MTEFRDSILPLNADWNPQLLADEILQEVENWWQQGWVYIKAEPDALWENVRISFKRTVLIE